MVVVPSFEICISLLLPTSKSIFCCVLLSIWLEALPLAIVRNSLFSIHFRSKNFILKLWCALLVIDTELFYCVGWE